MRGHVVFAFWTASLAITVACSKTPTFIDDTPGNGGSGGTNGTTTTSDSVSSTTASTTSSSTSSTSSSASSASSASSSSSSSSSSSASSASSSGVVASDCWAMDPNVWPSVSLVDTAALLNPSANPMQVLPDGLRIAYIGSFSGTPTPMVASRVARFLPFTNAVPLADWGPTQPAIQALWMDFSGEEMLVVGATKGTHVGLFSTIHQPPFWSVPQNLGIQVNDDSFDSESPTISADGSIAVYAKNDGIFSPQLSRSLYRLHELGRMPPVVPGASFGEQGFIQLDSQTMTDDIRSPVLSPDGKFLFFSSTYPYLANGQVGQLDHAATIYMAARTGLVWASPVHLDTFNSPTMQTAPLSITGDGCEFYFRRYTTTADASQIWVAKRGP